MDSAFRVLPQDFRYAVTADGEVLSRARGEWKALVKVPTTRGYPKVKLGGKRTFLVHILVAQEFIGPRPPRMTVNHIDGNKWNVAASNLEYISQGENNRHAWRTGLQRSGWDTRRQRNGGRSFARNGAYMAASPSDCTPPAACLSIPTGQAST